MTQRDKNILYASDLINSAAIFLEETHEEISGLLYQLSDNLLAELPENEKVKLNLYISKIRNFSNAC